MRLKLCLLFSLLLCLSSASIAQQLPPKAEQLKASIAEARQLLAQVKQERERLRSHNAMLQDSAAFEKALDSLRQTYADPQELKVHEDSMKAAFTDYQEVLRRLDEAEVRLREEITKATEAMARELTPQEAAEVLSGLEKSRAKSLTGAFRPLQMSVEQLPGLEEELPKPGELQEAAKAHVLEAAKEKAGDYDDELAGYRERAGKMESIKGEIRKNVFQVESLKGKGWQERLLVGAHWQFGSQERFFVDLGPYAAWRLSGRLTLGGGLQHRLSVSIKEKPWVSSSEKTYGYFGFADVEVLKGFFARLHYESLNTPVPRHTATGQVEQPEQEWVKGLSVGVGRNYGLFRHVRGFALLQYNLVYEEEKTPYLKPFQAKIGFYISGSVLVKEKK